MLTQSPLLLHDNAPAHRSHTGPAASLESGLEEMSRPPYFPNLAPPWTKIFHHWWAQVCDQEVAEAAARTFLFYRHPKTLRSL